MNDKESEQKVQANIIKPTKNSKIIANFEVKFSNKKKAQVFLLDKKVASKFKDKNGYRKKS